ncbi:MAG: hypothetical protein JWO93_1767 [Micrococcaceae bacterium]|nr:hypothetical protein [Micrococcaceae bacterium]
MTVTTRMEARPLSGARAARKQARAVRTLSALNTVGDVLLLQLCFFVASWGIITAFPAAVALQRQLDHVLDKGEPATVRSFAAELLSAFRANWRAAVVLPVVAAMLIIGILFWGSVDAPVGTVALLLLVPMAGASVGLYLCALAAVVDQPVTARFKNILASAWLRVQGQPLHVAGCVVIMLTWFLLLGRVPTLGLVGGGVLPAFLAVWLRRGMVNQRNGTPARTTGAR